MLINKTLRETLMLFGESVHDNKTTCIYVVLYLLIGTTCKCF